MRGQDIFGTRRGRISLELVQVRGIQVQVQEFLAGKRRGELISLGISAAILAARC